MIYTIGKTELYEGYFSTTTNLKKAKGGSVWETEEEAYYFLRRAGALSEFSVYGVEADWREDTELAFDEDGEECPYGSLTRDACLVKLDVKK